MRRTSVAIVCAVLVLLSSGCGKSDKSKDDDGGDESQPASTESEPWVYLKLELPGDAPVGFPEPDVKATLTRRHVAVECEASSLLRGTLTAEVDSGGNGAAAHDIETLPFPCISGAVFKLARELPLGHPNAATVRVVAYKAAEPSAAEAELLGKWETTVDWTAMQASTKDVPTVLYLHASASP